VSCTYTFCFDFFSLVALLDGDVFMGDDNDDVDDDDDDGDGRSSPAEAETYTPMSPSEDDDDVGKNIADCLL